MKIIFFIQIIAIASTFDSLTAARSVKCEQFRDFAKLCLMNNFTVLDTNDITVTSTRNEIEEMVFTGNRNVKFLPILVYQTWPNMREITAYGCSIQNISRSNFDKLNQMRRLQLENNQIEIIKSDTFRDLVRLESLNLGKGRNNIEAA